MAPSSAQGPVTHYEMFAGLRDAGVAYLVTGATALTLHGVPRITPDVDLAVAPNPENFVRLKRRLASWGYGEVGSGAPTTGGATIRRFRHSISALDEIDIILPPAADFARLLAGSVTIALVDLAIPLIGADDLRALKEHAGSAADREDARGLEMLASIHSGARGSDPDAHWEQIRKFSRWSVAARLDWLLAAARLRQGLSPEAKPLTHGLVRRRPWISFLDKNNRAG